MSIFFKIKDIYFFIFILFLNNILGSNFENNKLNISKLNSFFANKDNDRLTFTFG